MKPVDVHCHLSEERFDQDRDEVVREAREKLEFIVDSGARKEWNEKAVSLARENPGFVYATVGYHPIDAQDLSDQDVEEFERFVEENRDVIVGIGEIGLDHHWEKSPEKRALQEKRFLQFLEIARKASLPVIIHSWDAEARVVEILEEKFDGRVVLHCYSGPMSVLEKAISLGYYISVSTHVLFSKHHGKVAKRTPLDLLLLETDSPWLDPARGRNVPWNVWKSAEKIARLRGTNMEEIIRATTTNAKRVFGIE